MTSVGSDVKRASDYVKDEAAAYLGANRGIFRELAGTVDADRDLRHQAQHTAEAIDRAEREPASDPWVFGGEEPYRRRAKDGGPNDEDCSHLIDSDPVDVFAGLLTGAAVGGALWIIAWLLWKAVHA